ncbi:hypothetical protein HG535_0B01890 [Zygotorulaspora mrakii]|uniref:Uncharacterized protein n=1 Tax=Zygotorulaspora mrakii TaxID=42260 RepID=A0A7H9AXX7_ZYGMR|nr:uncharacterized protein HG535_0B01890 [Zygotorulaspora mrakii]QLG71151.1 hypothetical protein HG535_0B01890 [Zygotorulaspora mrakii]
MLRIVPSEIETIKQDSMEGVNNNENNIPSKGSYPDVEKDYTTVNNAGVNSMVEEGKANNESTGEKTSGAAIWNNLFKANKIRDELQTQIRLYAEKIKPIEFESYHEYFLIKTFKKGKSASGHVDIDSLRRRNSSIYYKKIKMPEYTAPGGYTNSSGTSSNNLLSEEEDEEDQDDADFCVGSGKGDARSYPDDLYGDLGDNVGPARKRRTRAQLAAQIEKDEVENAVSLKSEDAQSKKSPNRDVSYLNISTNNDSENPRRRSSRLSQKFSESKEASSSPDTQPDDRTTNIRDLYESLVPKVRQPYRRSDWILPSKYRYTPEKQMRTRPVYEKVKINELVASEKIRNVLSRFEGGVAGVRKRGWNTVS